MYFSKTRRVDRRNRRRRNETRQQGFMLQIEAFADSYTSYIYHRDHGTTSGPRASQNEENVMCTYQIRAQDTYSNFPYLIHVPLRIFDIIYRYHRNGHPVLYCCSEPMCRNSCAGCYTNRAPDTYAGLPRGGSGALQDGTF